MTRTIEQLLAEVIAREGGYVNHPADKGGATNFGITQAVARADGYTGDMRAFPRDRAAAIYRRLYWERPGFDQVAKRAPSLAAELFDTGINMGPSTASTFLQRALNALNRGGADYPDLVIDARVGPAVLSALDAFFKVRGRIGETVLVKACDALQGERYVSLAEKLPSQEAFLYGWLANRLGQAA